MKKYEVRMTMTVCVTVDVEAENPEDAEKKALEKTGRDEAFYLSHNECVEERNVVEVNECEEEKSELDKAIDYVREQMDVDDMAILQAEINKCYKNHLVPNDNVMDCSKVIDLLEEYGQDNDMPEGWWMEEGDIDDILLLLRL